MEKQGSDSNQKSFKHQKCNKTSRNTTQYPRQQSMMMD